METNQGLLERLEHAGYFRWHTTEQRSEFEAELVQRGDTAIWGDPVRLLIADAEDLAEGGIDRAYEEWSPLLRRAGVTLSVEETDIDAHYRIRVDGKWIEIYRGDETGTQIWTLATARSIQIVNDRLKAAGSEERLYALYGGNDLHVWLLTPPLFELICELAEHPGEQPYPPESLLRDG